MTEEHLFSKIPWTFVYCMNAECGRKESCLRHLAVAHAPKRQRVINVLNQTAVCGEEECSEYLSNHPVMMAYGWGKLYNGIDYNTAVAMKKELQSHFGRQNYYRYGRRERALTPQDQEYVKALFARHGVETEPEYEYFEEQYQW